MLKVGARFFYKMGLPFNNKPTGILGNGSCMGGKKVISEGKTLNWKNVRTLTNMRRDNLKSCIPYLNQYTDDVLLIYRITGL